MRLISRFILCLVCLFLVSYAAAATYYVDPAGNDAAPGTSTQPWRTIQKAAGAVSAGDAVVVRAGTYGGRVLISRSGTSAAPIRFIAEGTVATAGFSIRAGYVHVIGFRITAVAARYSVDGAGIYATGAGCRVENNVITRTGYYGIHFDIGSSGGVIKGNLVDQCALAGINVHGTGHLVEGNEIRDIRVSMAGNTYGDADGFNIFESGHIIRGNYVHSISLSANAGYTPHIDGVHSWHSGKFVRMTDCVFEQNVFDLPETTSTNHTAGFMIEGNPQNIIIRNNVIRATRAVHFVTGTNVRVLNNTLAGRLSWPTSRNPAGIYFEQTSSTIVRNNLIIDFPWYAIYVSGNSGLTIGTNCTWNSNGTRPNGAAQSGDLWGINPRVASLSGFDFHLLVDSPCRDAGVALSDVTDDFDSRPRPYGSRHDIGAFEYSPAGSTNQPPTASFTSSPQSGTAPLAVAFDGRASSDLDGTIGSYAWSFGDGGSGTGATASHTYTSAGTYTARLTVTDNGGLTASATRSITAAAAAVNQPPTASFTASPSSGDAPLAVAFDGRASGDPDGTIGTYAWSFGDGGNETGATASHTYASAGTYTARLTVTDNGGLSASATRTITVAASSGGGTGPFYVDAGLGNDANPGTSAQPWRTIQKAANSVSAGATVVVRAGTYGERVNVSRAGTASSPIRFTAEGTVDVNGFSLRASHVHVIGFRISSSGAIWSGDAAGVYVTATGCRIENNAIQRTAYVGILLETTSSAAVVRGNLCDQAALAGINAHGANHLIEGNEIRDTRVAMGGNAYNDADGMRIFGSGHTIRGNRIHGITLEANAGYSPHIDGFQSWQGTGFAVASDCVFEGNRIDLPVATSTTHSAGFMFESNPQNILIRNNVIRAGRAVHFLTGTNIRVLNNALVGSLAWPTGHNPAGIYFEQTSSSTVRNNLIVDFPWNAVYISGNSGLTIGNSCTWNSNGTQPRGTAQTGDLWGVNPRVASLSGLDLHIAVDSPCRDAGVALADVPDDFDGHARPYGPIHDIGAFEYVAGGTANQPPAASFTASPSSGRAPLTVSFDGRASSDPDGGIASYSWSFGDGASGSGATVSHKYTSAGTFTARLTVTDEDGGSASATRTITVTRRLRR